MAPVEPNSAEARLSIEVAYAPAPRMVDLVRLRVPLGSSVLQALQFSGLLERHGLAADGQLRCGVWGKLRPLDHPLRDGDRLEIYRPLKVDPKEARRQRYRRQERPGKAKSPSL